MNISVKFIWFDMWIGLFIDLKKHCIYVAPLPCVIIVFQWNVQYFVKMHGHEVLYASPNLSWLKTMGKSVRKKIWSRRKLPTTGQN